MKSPYRIETCTMLHQHIKMMPKSSISRGVFSHPLYAYICKNSVSILPTKSRVKTSNAVPEKGDIIELECKDIAFGGEGVAKTPDGDFVIFVPRTLPGEKFTARVTSVKKSSHARATKLSTLHPHSNAVDAPCPYFSQMCGGCSFQSLEYTAQLVFKELQVKNHTKRIGGFNLDEGSRIAFQSIIPCDTSLLYRYRNKMEFSFGNSSTASDEVFDLGLHKPGSRDAILPLSSCMLQTTTADTILNAVDELCRKFKFSAFDDSKHSTRNGRRMNMDTHTSGKKGDDAPAASSSSLQNTGSKTKTIDKRIMQHVTLRHSLATDSYLINFTTSRDARKDLAPLVAELLLKINKNNIITGVINTVLVPGRPLEERRISKEYILAGEGYLVEKVQGLELELSANAFFQVNTKQADVLYSLIKKAAAVTSKDVVLDLFTGGGSIALMLAKSCKCVYGVDICQQSIDDANKNAERNGIENVGFICCDVEKFVPAVLEKDDDDVIKEDANVVIVDPARPGLGENIIDYLLDSKQIERIVYVSCNPSTQARDLKKLSDVYDVVSIQPVDMMPQGPHIECIAVLHRK